MTVRGASVPYFSLSILMMSSTTVGSTCDIFKSSTCHRIVHCFPLITLFATQLSYGFSLNSHFSSCPLRSFQNSSAACSVPYNAFRSRTYITGFPFSLLRYLLYFCLFTFVSDFARGPERRIYTVSSILALHKSAMNIACCKITFFLGIDNTR